MHARHRIASIAAVSVLAILAASAGAQRGAPANAQADVTARIVAAAPAVLTALDDSGRANRRLTRWCRRPIA